MAQIATIPIPKIEKIQLYVNTAKKSLAAIKAETGAEYALNGGFFDLSTWKPVMHLRVDGKTHSSDQYNYNGFGWNEADIRSIESKDKIKVKNFICGVELVHSKMSAQMYYDKSSVGGTRGRSAIALKDGSLLLYCVGDKETGRCTPEELRSEMLSLGVDYAVMLDGGQSSQCDFNGKRIIGGREVQNLILVYLKKEQTMKTPLVFLDPGHGGTDKSNGAPDGSYKEHEFSLDMGLRIRSLLTAQGVRVGMTREVNATVSLTGRAALANEANADLFVSLHSNASGNTWSNSRGLVVYTCAEGGTRDVMAKNIIKRMKEAGVKTFGYELYHQKFTVIWKTTMPACLIEFLFHTNKEDVALLQDPAYRDKMAVAAAKGICDTLGITYKEKTKTKYTVTVATLDSMEDAQKVVDKLREIGVTATIKEESA